MDLDINIENNPHILLGRGLFSISFGDFYATFPGDTNESRLGFLAFHPLINPVPMDHLDDEVSMDNIHDITNPPVSLVFSTVQSAKRLVEELESLIQYMEAETNG